MFDTLSTEQIKTYANKAGIKPSEAKKELKSMAHWQPQKAVKVFEALKAVGTKLDKPVTPPTLPNLGGVEQIQALEQQLAVEKSVPKKARIRKQIAELQKHSPIDQAAHQAATSVQNDLPEPTQAQIEAGNYKKGHIKVHGLDIAIENPRGSERRGKDPDGNEWAHTMSDHYGYFKRTIGSDKENIDTYVGRNPESEQVFIVDQLDQQTDGFDEHKVMLGFNSQDEAVKAYSSNFDKGWKVGPVHTMTKDEFKTWLKEGDTTKPAGESIQQSKIFAQIQSDSRLTHSIPIKLMDQVHELGSIVNDLTSIKTEGVKTNVLYGKQLLAKIAKLNPDVQIHIISDLNNIQDKTIRAGLVDGGYYVPAQNTSYIYPKSKAWQSSALELVNHELVHSVSEQIIFDSLLPQEYDQKLNKMIAKIGDYLFENSELLSENVTNRLSYAFNTNPQHEVLAVGIAELEVRESLKNILGNTGLLELDGIFTAITEQYGNSNEQRKQRSDTGNGEKILHGTVPGTDTGTADRLQDVPAGTESGKKHKRSIRTDQTDLSAGEKQQGITDKKRFSRAENRIASSTVEQIRDALVSRFGEKTIADLEAQGILNIVQDQQESMTGNVEGWYENGKVTLVASNLDADSAVATFLHELGGHGGFQNLMNKDAYADLMRQFERMVAQGNPVALEAKRLAERELNREVQLDEYLPYMITLASQMQTKNILQKGAIKRFMDQMISAVKAWLYDKGIKLNLNEKDILALAERMVAAQSSVASNNEDSSSVQNDDIRFSRSSNYSDITNRIMNGFKSLPKVADNKGKDWLKIGLQALTRRQLTEIYSKILPPLNKYNDLAAQMDADKNDAGAEADNIVREWSKLKDENQLAGLMHDATLAKIDPAKPHVAGDSIIKYQQLRNDFNTLSPEAQAMYIKARDAYKKHYANIHQAIKERILRSELSSQKKADLLKKMDDNFFNGYIKGVYFPLARFGEYVIVVRNKNNQVESVSRAETMGEAESVRSELMKKYPLFIVDPIKLDKEFNASRDSVGRGFMSSLFDEVDNLGLAAKEQAEFEDTLSQLYLSSMPDISWAKHGIHRKGTAGFSQDARRAFAQNMFSGANYLAKLRYGDQLVEQLDKMQKHADEQFKNDVHYDQRSAQRVIGEMNKRHDNLMNPQGNPLSSFLTSVGFMYYMGLSPAAAMVNLSQTALIAYPLMGAKWNYDKAGKELLKASRDFAKGVEFNVPDFSSLENFKNSIGDVYSPNIDKVINGLELDAYNQAVSRGVIDVTQAHDLAGIAQGEDSKVMWYFRPAMRLASGLFHHAERFNREVTFIAAYRLATKAGASHTEAFDQAMDMVYRGHFDYSAGNRARFMQSNIAKVVLLFKQYAQNMLYTLLRNAHQSIYALDPKDQREARRALAGILGMHALAAGAIGLPITGMLATASILIAKKSKLGAAAFGIAAMAALASGGGDDDPYELENVIRNWLSDIHPMFADLVFGGVPRAFSPVDLSGRVGLNNLIIPDVQDGLEGADWAKAMQSALLGPVVGISTNLVKGFQEINDGDYGRGIETMLPVVLKNAMKSVRFGREGVLTKNNDVIQDEVGGVGLFSQAIGFSPSDVRTSMEGRSAIYQYKTRLENHRKELMHKWVIAKRDDDSEGMEKAWAEIQEFNEKVSEKNPRMRINRINLMQSYKTNERRAKETGDGGVYLTKRQKGAEEQGRFAFGE
ncbi:hypothetical protein B9T38_11875 [Acinetobacter sp. ANC 4218]|nr:hypothetical protein B9T38_11875 [Acinetobacter sp. ANC 4218]